MPIRVAQHLLAVFLFALLSGLLSTVSFTRANERDESLTAWYAALAKADVVGLEALMAPDDLSPFEYEVKDLGFTQNKAEFIASMAEWVGAIKGGSIDYKITDAYEGGYSVMVCYRFTDSELLATEEVGVYDTKITRITQEGKGDSCAAF